MQDLAHLDRQGAATARRVAPRGAQRLRDSRAPWSHRRLGEEPACRRRHPKTAQRPRLAPHLKPPTHHCWCCPETRCHDVGREASEEPPTSGRVRHPCCTEGEACCVTSHPWAL